MSTTNNNEAATMDNKFTSTDFERHVEAVYTETGGISDFADKRGYARFGGFHSSLGPAYVATPRALPLFDADACTDEDGAPLCDICAGCSDEPGLIDTTLVIPGWPTR